MRSLRSVTDFMVSLLLVGVLLWCGFLFLGAYSQHKLGVLLNRSTLAEINKAIVQQAKGELPRSGDAITDEQMRRLQEAQNQLLDKDTMAFLLQTVSLFLVIAGVAVLQHMLSAHRETQEWAAKTEGKLERIQRNLALFVAGRSNTVVLAMQCVRLHSFVQMYPLCDRAGRQNLHVTIRDCLSDALRHLEDAVGRGVGLEEPLFVSVALDAIYESDRVLNRIHASATGPDRNVLAGLVEQSSRCIDLLKEHGKELVGSFNDHRRGVLEEGPR